MLYKGVVKSLDWFVLRCTRSVELKGAVAPAAQKDEPVVVDMEKKGWIFVMTTP